MSDPAQLEVRLEELKQLLLSRDYRPKVVDAAIAKAKAIPRERALQKVEKKESDRVVFALSFDPRLPSVSGIFSKHHKVMTDSSPHLKQVFPLPPLVAFRRPKNLRDTLVKAKVPDPLVLLGQYLV